MGGSFEEPLGVDVIAGLRAHIQKGPSMGVDSKKLKYAKCSSKWYSRPQKVETWI